MTIRIDNPMSLIQLQLLLDDIYVNETGDTMTGELIITPAGDTALTANKDIVLKPGRKMIFNG
jgi:hypothetical protein